MNWARVCGCHLGLGGMRYGNWYTYCCGQISLGDTLETVAKPSQNEAIT